VYWLREVVIGFVPQMSVLSPCQFLVMNCGRHAGKETGFSPSLLLHQCSPGCCIMLLIDIVNPCCLKYVQRDFEHSL
jgi:hypothetical protein